MDTVERLPRWQRWLTGTLAVSFAFARELKRRKGCAGDTRKEGDPCSLVYLPVYLFVSLSLSSLCLLSALRLSPPHQLPFIPR